MEEYANPRVVEAMRQVPRHRFVHPIFFTAAYKDKVIPIPFLRRKGEEATISQPRVVAMMTNLLDPRPDERILEIGTASGYQAAVLSKLSAQVVSVEIIPQLAERAKKRLKKLGIENVDIVRADGSIPFARRDAFDKILVTASVVPHQTAIDLSTRSLKVGGALVAPIGGKYGESSYGDLIRIRKKDEGFEIEESIPDVSFVLMRGRAGWDTFVKGYVHFIHQEFFNENKKEE